jgi:xanthine dehydrogenase accessory factor
MKSIYNIISELESNDQCAAICILVDYKGSTPRKTGAKMIVFHDGKIIGSIGGGNIEKQVITDAQESISKNQAFKKIYYNSTDRLINCPGEIEVYIEPVSLIPKLFIFGAGHIGAALSKIALELGFNISVFDNRIGIFENFKSINVNIIPHDYSHSIDNAIFDNNTYIVIATSDHSTDEDILSRVAKKTHAYIGMVGSKGKVESIRKKLLENSTLTIDELNSIDMPVGIKFKAITPEEIAISIAAKLIDVKNNKMKF